MEDNFLIGGADGKHISMLPEMANRHGIITGATGTGKTVTLQVLAENFSRNGVPVFVADVKGDFSGIQSPGKAHPKVDERIKSIGIEGFEFSSCPVEFWDVFGEQGTPVRSTISEMGPLLLGRLLGLNDTQNGVLHIAFRVADDSGMLLLDLKDLRSMLKHLADNNSEFEHEYGNIASSSVGAIQRSILVLEDQGGDKFFGEPNISIRDFIRQKDGKGVVNILAANKLMTSPKVYSTFLLWLLSELFEELPEVGDVDKPVIAFFFDEAHLLFDEANDALQEKIEQVVKLIRSKGVGVYFITQNPLDIPDPVLAQLGNRIQHALRAYTPREQKAVRAAAGAFRANPNFDTGEVITQLGVGEALVSVLDEKGAPTVVEKTLIRPPYSQIGPIDASARQFVLNGSDFNQRYAESIDRESAHEMLAKRTEERIKVEQAEEAQEEAEKVAKKAEKATKKGGRKRMGMGERVMSNILSSAGRKIGNQIVRGILGSILKG